MATPPIIRFPRHRRKQRHDFLNPRQHSVVAAAVTVLCGALLVGVAVLVLLLLGTTLSRFSAVLMPPAAAAIFAFVLKPYYEWLHKRTGERSVLSSLLVIVSIAVPTILLLAVYGTMLVKEFTGLMVQIPGWLETLWAQLESARPELAKFFEKYGLSERMGAAFDDQAKTLVRGARLVGTGALSAGVGLTRMVGSLLGWAVFPVYVFFFLMAPSRRPEDLEKPLDFLTPRLRRDLVYLAREFVNILVSFFRGQLIIALIQGGLFAAGFSIAGLKYGLVLGLTLGLLNIVPYLGNMIGLLICLPLAYFQSGGGWPTLLAVVVVILIVQNIEAYFLTPKIMGDRTGLHPATIIFALFFWGAALNGIAGMILAIPLTAFLAVLWRLVRHHYLRPAAEGEPARE